MVDRRYSQVVPGSFDRASWLSAQTRRRRRFQLEHVGNAILNGPRIGARFWLSRPVAFLSPSASWPEVSNAGQPIRPSRTARTVPFFRFSLEIRFHHLCVTHDFSEGLPSTMAPLYNLILRFPSETHSGWNHELSIVPGLTHEELWRLK